MGYAYYDTPSSHSVSRHYGVKTSEYKLIHFYAPEINAWELYDLTEDPNEMNNLYSVESHSSVRDTMHATMSDVREKYTDNCPPLCVDVSGPPLCPGGDVQTCKSWCEGHDVMECY